MARKRKKSSKAGKSGKSAANASANASPKKAPQKKAASASGKRSSGLSSVSRRTWMLTAVGAVAAAGGASALHAWDVRTRERHDLGVIGDGMPVVVQIHDRNCPTCRRLKSAMHSALDERDDIQYRIADIAKQDGRELQERFDVPNVSLLFFDADGTHRYTHTGLLDAEGVTEMVNEVLGQMSDLPS